MTSKHIEICWLVHNNLTYLTVIWDVYEMKLNENELKINDDDLMKSFSIVMTNENFSIRWTAYHRAKKEEKLRLKRLKRFSATLNARKMSSYERGFSRFCWSFEKKATPLMTFFRYRSSLQKESTQRGRL